MAILRRAGKIKSDSMTSRQFVADTIEVSKYLCNRFNLKKIYLMGHSWGSFIAIQAAAEAPELYNAYIGVGQITNTEKSEKIAYEYMLHYYEEHGDIKTLNKLKNMDVDSKEYSAIRDDVMHRAGIGTTHNMKSVIKGIFIPSLLYTEYTLTEKINLWKGKVFSMNHTKLKEELSSTDITKLITKLNIPVYFFSGKYDYTVCWKLSEEYLRKLEAPIKGFYLFENSAHSPIFEEPEKVNEIITKDVLNGTDNLADVKSEN
jgi:pimeloyl-ACP methyl ester carboxylesterase